MSIVPVIGPPGMRAPKTALHRVITRGSYLPDVLPQGKLISGACSRDPGNSTDITRLRAGLLMGKIASVVNSLGTAGYYAPSVIGVLNGALAAGGTTVTVAAVVVTEIVRRCGATGTFKITGPPVANGTVVTETATYTATGATTLTVNALANAFVTGSFVQPTDGSEDVLTFMPDGWPTIVVDPSDSSNQDVPFPCPPVGMIVDSTQLLPAWPSDTGLQEWVYNHLSRPAGGKFTFSTAY